MACCLKCDDMAFDLLDCVEEAQSDETPSIRKDFPETWIWDENPDEKYLMFELNQIR